MDESEDSSDSDQVKPPGKTATKTAVAPKQESSEDSSDELHIVKPNEDVKMADVKGIKGGQKRKREIVEDNTVNKKRKLDTNGDTNGDANGSGNTKIRVSNLAFSLEGKDQEIKDQFKSCGNIASSEMIYRADGRWAGVCLLIFENEEGAAKALELNDVELYERPMNVSYPREERSMQKKSSFQHKPKIKPDGCNTVWIGNLSYEIDENEVWEFFGECGDIKEVRWPNGDFTGIGWVEFFDTNAPDLAVQKAGQILRGREIRIDYAEPRKRRNDNF